MPLRFRYTSYMGEDHPAEKKVVVEFTTADMPNLTPIQREKLKKLVGVRYNPTTDIVKISCEMYESQAQNKRYLGNVIDSLLIEARVFHSLLLNTSANVSRIKPTHSRTFPWIHGITILSQDPGSPRNGQ
jgi:small subunit ribosomal protein S35